jgi:hypothetical protein
MNRKIWTTAGIATLTFAAGVVVGRSFAAKSPPPVTASSAIVAVETPSAEPHGVEPAPLADVSHDAAVATYPLAARERDRPLDAAATSQSTTKQGISSSLDDERAIIDGARAALFRGRPTDALIMTEQHENLFPHGALSEDRDFLRVNALRDLGRTDEARSRTRVFLATYPHSAFGRALLPLLAAAPDPPTSPPPVPVVPPPTAEPTSTATTTSDPPEEPMDPNAHGAY